MPIGVGIVMCSSASRYPSSSVVILDDWGEAI